MKFILYTVFAVFALTQSPGSWASRFKETPLNTAILMGETVVLRCGSTFPEDTIVWREYITKPKEGQLIGEQDKLHHPTRRDRYKLHRISANKFQLTIMSVKMDDAGMYTCYSTHAGDSISAELVVLMTAPDCSSTHTSAVEGDYVIYSCQVAYNGAWAPVMEWTTETGGQIPNLATSSSSVTAKSSRYNAIVMAKSKYNGRRCKCKVFFAFPTVHGKACATNRPNYTYSYVAEPLLVFAPPRDVAVVPEKYYYYAGEMVECAAHANPPARYKWVEMRTGKVQDINVLTLSKDMLGRKYKCVAYNVIQGAEHSKEIIVQFRTYQAPAYVWFMGLFLRAAALTLVLLIAPYRTLIYNWLSDMGSSSAGADPCIQPPASASPCGSKAPVTSGSRKSSRGSRKSKQSLKAEEGAEPEAAPEDG
ncbi:hypothetical protein NP493_813g01057 [Ridgeia piscesae]|uniref:Ig-like domain-containing protein n=1 Tax=Ridgeia piscesae TaxID=27915 RepID=A0AAD9KMV6_RIDPI|nr:hypothetical protein NP493_813g01057 [Ridgeia piscesae]